MSRIETVRDNWTEIITKLLHDKQELANFLRFSAGMYKQSFSDAALIYLQNPNATKVATLEMWNKLTEIQSWEKMRLLAVEHQVMEEIVFRLRD